MKKLFFSFMILSGILSGSIAFAQDDFSSGSNYYLIFLDEETATQIPANQIKGDYRINDNTYFLYIWDNTYLDAVASGPNYNGEVGAFLNLQVQNVGWSGLGFCANPDFGGKVDMTGIGREYTFHIAMKSSAANSHLISLQGGAGISAGACIGSAPFVDGPNTFPAYTDFTRNNKWQLVEIPMSYFFDNGLSYRGLFDDNYMTFLSGNSSGTTIALDAIFIYKKNSASADKTDINNTQILVTSQTITALGLSEGFDLYNINGVKVATTESAIMGIENMAKGIYLVKSGSFVKKIQIK